MMADVINSGTAARARSLGFTLPAAGKTGTTNDYQRRVVCRLHAAAARRGLGRLRPAAYDIAGRVRQRRRGAAVGGVHEGGDQRRQAGVVLRRPADVTTAVVCRMSGKLATEGCEHVEVVDAKGQLERRSMVYTDYFAKGTQPTEPLRPASDAGILRADRDHLHRIGKAGAAPPRRNCAATAPSDVGRGRQPRPRPRQPPGRPKPPKKKRGFWSRVFGRDGGKDERRNEERRNEDERSDKRQRRRGEAVGAWARFSNR